jgi:hypothetical protein
MIIGYVHQTTKIWRIWDSSPFSPSVASYVVPGGYMNARRFSVTNRAKVPVSILRRFSQNLTARLRRAQQLNVTFSRTSLFYDSPFSTYCHQHQNHSKMPEFYAEIEACIEQALHELHDCENPILLLLRGNSKFPCRDYAPDGTDVR